MFLPTILWALIGFALGAVPFSVLFSRQRGGADPRAVGDRNPGAFNAWRAAGWQAGVPTMLLDFLKGAIPVGLAQYRVGLSGLDLLPVAVGPVAGHIFSPWLGFRGGKGLAVSIGVWAGMTMGEAALVLGLFLALFYFTVRPEAWAVMLGLLGLGAHLWLRAADPWLFVTWVAVAALLGWTHRADLRRPPMPRPALLDSLRGASGR